MGRILQKLYAGELSPADHTVTGNAQYDALCARVLEEMEDFTGKLDKDMRREFETIMEGHLELAYIEKSQSFCDGFTLGAGIMVEVLGSEDKSQFSGCI